MYEIAYLLHRTVYEIENEISYEEFLGWCDYFERRPPGWRDDQRTYMQLSAWGVKEKADKVFPSLAALGKPKGTVVGTAFEQLIAGAVGGATIPKTG